MSRILLLNGPNLNLLGQREPDHYGHRSLQGVVAALSEQAQDSGCELIHYQSNAEHELIDALHRAREDQTAFVIANPGALTHTSIALRDALLALELPFIEVHLSNVHARESFRQHSYLSDIASGIIVGLGAYGYELALQAALRYLKNN